MCSKIGYILVFALLLFPVNTYAFDTNMCLIYGQQPVLTKLNDTTYDIVDTEKICEMDYDIANLPVHLFYWFIIYVVYKIISFQWGVWDKEHQKNLIIYRRLKRKHRGNRDFDF